MVRINLLPWREERRQQLTNEFYVMLGVGLVLGLLLVLGGYWVYDKSIDFQHKRNNYLKAEIAKLDNQIKEIETLESKRDNLLARKRVIEELQASRTQMVHLFDELVGTIPNGVFLEKIQQQGNNITLEGYAQSHSRVSAYMRNLDASPWFKSTEVEYIKVDDSIETHEQKFRLGVKLVNPKSEENEESNNDSEQSA